MDVYKNRYQADKARKTDPYHRSDEVIVKVTGGYALMSASDYRAWKKQN